MQYNSLHEILVGLAERLTNALVNRQRGDNLIVGDLLEDIF